MAAIVAVVNTPNPSPFTPLYTKPYVPSMAMEELLL